MSFSLSFSHSLPLSLSLVWCVRLTGNDSGSTGDASSTAGETQSPDAASSAITAAASSAALQPGYDGTPLVCFPSELRNSISFTIIFPFFFLLSSFFFFLLLFGSICDQFTIEHRSWLPKSTHTHTLDKAVWRSPLKWYSPNSTKKKMRKDFAFCLRHRGDSLIGRANSNHNKNTGMLGDTLHFQW